jgi:hypothetical protein
LADYSVVAYFQYSVLDGVWTLTEGPTPLVETYEDANTTFTIGEDLAPDLVPGSLYIGFITIGGVDYPVVTGGGGDTSIARVLIPSGTDPATVSAPSSVDTNSLGSPFTAAPLSHCFAAGSLIATPAGEVCVEDLERGQTVLTADGREVAVVFVGWQDIDTRFIGASANSLVRIAAGALGNGLPRRDLTVTGNHAMLLDGLLVTAAALVNGRTIRTLARHETADVVRVYHVETEAHEVLLAEGAATESFVDYAGRRTLGNASTYLATFGAERLIREMDLPRVTVRRMLPASLRARLDAAPDAEALPLAG